MSKSVTCALMLIGVLAGCGSKKQQKDEPAAADAGASSKKKQQPPAPTDAGTVAVPTVDAAPPAPTVKALTPAGGACHASGWCRFADLVPGDEVEEVFVTAPDSVWLAGAGGLVRHWNGSTFQHWRVGEAYLTSVWAGATDTWVVGSAGFAARLRDGAWTTIATGVTDDMHDVWATSDGTAWMISNTTLFKVVDTTVTAIPLPEGKRANVIWAAAPDDIWVGNYEVLRWNGTAWRDAGFKKLDEDGRIRDIGGTSARDVWLNWDGDAVQWNGKKWKRHELELDNGGRISVRSPKDVVVSASNGWRRWNGKKWTERMGTYGRRTRHLDDRRLVTVRNELTIVDGETIEAVFAPGIGFEANDLWASDDAVWIVGYGWWKVGADGGRDNRLHVARWDGTSWQRWQVDGAVGVVIDGVGTTPWIAGENAAFHLEGGEWKVETYPGFARHIAVVAPDDVWIAGSDQLFHRVAGTWIEVPIEGLSGIAAIDAGDDGTLMVAARLGGNQKAQLLRWNGAGFDPLSEVPVSSYSREQLVVRSATDAVFVAGGEVARWNGTGWAETVEITPSAWPMINGVTYVDDHLVLAGAPPERVRSNESTLMVDFENHAGGAVTLDGTAFTWELFGASGLGATSARKNGEVWMLQLPGGDVWYHPGRP